MATSVQFRPHSRDLGMVVREVDEDLAIFLGMKNGEKERTVLAHMKNGGSTSVEPKPESSLLSTGLGEEAFRSLDDDSLLTLETGKNEHDWLLAQQDGDEQDLAAKPAVASVDVECISLNSEQLPKPNSLESSAAASKRPLSSNGRKPSSRAATPTRRPALPAKSKPSRASTPTSRAPSKPAAAAPATVSSKPMVAQPRASTPSRIAPRSSTPTSRATTPAARSKPASTSRTSVTSAPAPTRKPSTPSTKSPSDGASTRGKTGSVATKNPVSIRGGSSSRPSNPSLMLSVSHNAPQSVKTSMPKRPASASRGRPAAPLSSPSKVKPRQKSCSPTRPRAPVTNARKNGSTTLSRSRVGGGDDVNPVLMGTKMVERVVNSRKLAPPKQDEHVSLENPKRSSHENSGFGRSLSKKSLDMAMRHMDIGRSVNASGGLRPVATPSVLAYFSNGNQSSSSQSSSFGVSESPITSSSDSSKSSNCVNSYFS